MQKRNPIAHQRNEKNLNRFCEKILKHRPKAHQRNGKL